MTHYEKSISSFLPELQPLLSRRAKWSDIMTKVNFQLILMVHLLELDKLGIEDTMKVKSPAMHDCPTSMFTYHVMERYMK